MRSRHLLAALAALLLAAGCSDSREDPPDGRYRFLHLAPSLGITTFVLEASQVTQVDYGGATGSSLPLDSGPFDFHADTLVAGQTGASRVASYAATIQADRIHTFVLFDDGQIRLEEYVSDPADANSTEAQVQVLHAVAAAGTVDVYVEADGADLSAANPRASIAFRQLSAPIAFAAGEYRISVTQAGDPTNLLFRSDVVDFAEGANGVVAVYPGAGSTTAAIRMTAALESGSAILSDTATPAQFRTIHAATTSGPLDVYLDQDFSQPLHGAVAFGDRTAYAALDAGERTLSVTPAGNTGVIEVEGPATIAFAGRVTQLVTGAPGSLDSRLYIDNNRGIAARAQVRFRHGASSTEFVNIYVTEPGASIADETPSVIALQVAAPESVINRFADDYELTVVLNDEDPDTEDTTVIAGPLPVTLENGRVYDVVLLDAAAQGQIDVIITDETGS